MSAHSYRYQLPRKAIKSDCPACGPMHRNTLSRYIDTQTGEPLPDIYGRCDRESNCGYYLSPYTKGQSGLSYADEVYLRWKEGNQRLESFTQSLVSSPAYPNSVVAAASSDVLVAERPIYSIPDEVFTKSLGYYEQNQFARLLCGRFGKDIADKLIQQFQIGTSKCWNGAGACVFWLIDEQGRKRGGQLKLFADDWHTVKYVDQSGRKRSRTSWVHAVLTYQYEKTNSPYPQWLTDYNEQGSFAPCLFGLPQLLTAPEDQPIAIVEAPKTAVLCSLYFPQFLWMAVVGRSYLNAERLAPLRKRHIVLFPDLSTAGRDYQYWQNKADMLRQQGFSVKVSDYLERRATDEQREKGYDLADFLLLSDPIESSSLGLPPEENNVKTNQRIQDTVSASEAIQPKPTIQLPNLVEAKWSVFARPPYGWNKIATHKSLLHCLKSNEPAPETVTTLSDLMANPSSILKPDEAKIERLIVEPTGSYPSEWDAPNDPDAIPTIKAMSFFEWQKQDPSFSKMGLASLRNT